MGFADKVQSKLSSNKQVADIDKAGGNAIGKESVSGEVLNQYNQGNINKANAGQYADEYDRKAGLVLGKDTLTGTDKGIGSKVLGARSETEPTNGHSSTQGAHGSTNGAYGTNGGSGKRTSDTYGSGQNTHGVGTTGAGQSTSGTYATTGHKSTDTGGNYGGASGATAGAVAGSSYGASNTVGTSGGDTYGTSGTGASGHGTSRTSGAFTTGASEYPTSGKDHHGSTKDTFGSSTAGTQGTAATDTHRAHGGSHGYPTSTDKTRGSANDSGTYGSTSGAGVAGVGAGALGANALSSHSKDSSAHGAKHTKDYSSHENPTSTTGGFTTGDDSLDKKIAKLDPKAQQKAREAFEKGYNDALNRTK